MTQFNEKFFYQVPVITPAQTLHLIGFDASNNDAAVLMNAAAIIAFLGYTPTSPTSLTDALAAYATLGGNTFTAIQNSPIGFNSTTGLTNSGGQITLGRVGDDAYFRVLGTASPTLWVAGAIAGDVLLQATANTATLHLSSGFGDPAAIKITGQVAFFNGDLKFTTAGKGIYIKEGSNACMGTLALNGTTGVVVSTSKVTANSRIFLTHNATGGTPGFCYVDSRSAGVSFTVKGTAGDTSTIAWMIVEPAP